VQYRLAQMDPEPSREPVLTRPDEVPMSRVSVMRAEMGLPPIEPSDMARFMEAAFDDVAEAVRFVKARHGDYGVDPERIVLGGFSAGGRCAAYAAYGKRVGVAGVFSISGPLMPVPEAANANRLNCRCCGRRRANDSEESDFVGRPTFVLEVDARGATGTSH